MNHQTGSTPAEIPHPTPEPGQTAIRFVFGVYGFRFSLRGAPPKAVEGIREDFAFFAAGTSFEPPEADEAVVELFDQEPPRTGLPGTDASVYTPRNIVYRSAGQRFIDYHGRALGIQDERSGGFRLYSRDPDLLYEAAYLYLLSRIGQQLDRSGRHRIHALGLVIRKRGVLVLLPMGGGKSTLALHLLSNPAVRILSDDSPFIDRRGELLAYPLRLGLLPGSEKSIPPQHRRMIRRMEFGPKHLVNYSYFRDRVCAEAPPGLVLLGARRITAGCSIEEVGMLTGLRACVSNCIVGVGLFQGLEFILQASPWELVKQSRIGLSRFWNCLRLLRRSRVCRVHLGSSPEENAKTVFEYASRLFDRPL